MSKIRTIWMLIAMSIIVIILSNSFLWWLIIPIGVAIVLMYPNIVKMQEGTTPLCSEDSMRV